ncbi:MAG: hypothetical protein A2086_09740 [Spirochaetes bacterium GWD1_27_9]|nr:MAG: hypothetical protein A2Y34_00745 [Spirochaetes bacterium GWC1_27_15]OHD32728.1 MAG: hypothetical protein A2086_09740 [Spirochaetes bacterium GWD1_27_9]
MQEDDLKNTIIEIETCSLTKKDRFKSVLTFKYLLEYWQNIDKENPFYLIYESKIKRIIEENHPILHDIDDFSKLNDYKDVIKDLMTVVFSPVSSDTEISAAYSLDFENDPLFSTEAYKKSFLTEENSYHKISDEELKEISCKRLVFIYAKILKEFYDFEIFFDNVMSAKIENKNTGLIKYYNSSLDTRFLKIVKKGELPVLTEDDRKNLSENLNNIPLLLKMIPPKLFELQGFIIIHKTDVTTQEILSEIKRELLNKNSILNKKNFNNLQYMIKSLLNKSNINLSIAAIRNNEVLILNSGLDNCDDIECIYRESRHYNMAEYKNSIFDVAFTQKKVLIVNDYPEYYEKSNKTPIDTEILKKGAKSVVIRPLIMEGKIIGVCTLSSNNTCEFDPLNLMKIEDVYPLFALVIQRSLEDFNNEVQSIVQKNFTSIHPSIEWRFKKAAVNLIDKSKGNTEKEMEQIVFQDVYPLYCTTDIRGSSTQRNAAIQLDLQEHLFIVKDIIDSANNIKNLPILDEFVYRINKYLTDLTDGLVSGDELEIINFLHKEIETCFNDLKLFSDDVRHKIEKYNDILDPELGTLYKKRRDFDDSVDLINKTISNYLDRVQQDAQKMFPHYFDKNTTDGVDQNIYIGASLTDSIKFDKLYLKNLRLWQLIILANIARLTDKLKAKLRVPLETTHLLVVQDMPLTLVFKTDEKKLAVEGAYNIRYEIMKKRIDKAIVKDTGERLTQIGKIAIVYTQNSEAFEYKQYIEFLSAKGYLDNNIEELLLEDLQGIKGLKALRVGVNLSSDSEYYSFSDIITQIGID